jgi:hypothetical protein
MISPKGVSGPKSHWGKCGTVEMPPKLPRTPFLANFRVADQPYGDIEEPAKRTHLG